MSQFKVYGEAEDSPAFDDLYQARKWAKQLTGWFEIVDMCSWEVVETAEDWGYPTPTYY